VAGERRTTLTDQNRRGIVVTIKGDGAPPWIVYHALDAQDAQNMMREADNLNLYEDAAAATGHFRQANVLVAGLGPVTPVNDAPAAAYGQPNGYSAPPAATGVPVHPVYGPHPSCSHGVKKFLEKPNRNGQGTWKAWACPAPQGDATSHGLDFIRG
jgi:hypothetical protein